MDVQRTLYIREVQGVFFYGFERLGPKMEGRTDPVEFEE